jgi:hypothetical protein
MWIEITSPRILHFPSFVRRGTSLEERAVGEIEIFKLP